jgi:hypothetical protein
MTDPAEPVWKIEVEIPMRVLNDVDHEALFTAVADAVHDWEPPDRDGWDVSVSAGIWALPDGAIDPTLDDTIEDARYGRP